MKIFSDNYRTADCGGLRWIEFGWVELGLFVLGWFWC